VNKTENFAVFGGTGHKLKSSPSMQIQSRRGASRVQRLNNPACPLERTFDNSIYSTDRPSPARQIARVERRIANCDPRTFAAMFLPSFIFHFPFSPSVATNLRARGRASEPAFG